MVSRKVLDTNHYLVPSMIFFVFLFDNSFIDINWLRASLQNDAVTLLNLLPHKLKWNCFRHQITSLLNNDVPAAHFYNTWFGVYENNKSSIHRSILPFGELYF